MPTPRGIKVYKTVLNLTKRNRLFKGPKFTNKQLVDYKENEKHSYMTTKNWLIEKKFIRPIFDAEKNIDRFELTEYAYEFLQTYVDTITKGATYPGPRMLRRIAKFALYSWIVLCIIIIQKLLCIDDLYDTIYDMRYPTRGLCIHTSVSTIIISIITYLTAFSF